MSVVIPYFGIWRSHSPCPIDLQNTALNSMIKAIIACLSHIIQNGGLGRSSSSSLANQWRMGKENEQSWRKSDRQMIKATA